MHVQISCNKIILLAQFTLEISSYLAEHGLLLFFAFIQLTLIIVHLSLGCVQIEFKRLAVSVQVQKVTNLAPEQVGQCNVDHRG